MRHPTFPPLLVAQASRGQADDFVDAQSHPVGPVSRMIEVATHEAHKEALARWPLLAEIDRSLAEKGNAPVELDSASGVSS
ncbi:MAG: hypothetical protein EPN31_12225 [Castellaniella sp.]|uniref:hypothetical protein n=1 Tax=Castellaniella sp. TaxID=1955812 RepID=UPI0011FD6116|nr:hypothetical protein [Castellaniella sp.]TAN27289.1 MAG: hypothetical protein EPN31_12225 [Castellaniella sp.]